MTHNVCDILNVKFLLRLSVFASPSYTWWLDHFPMVCPPKTELLAKMLHCIKTKMFLITNKILFNTGKDVFYLTHSLNKEIRMRICFSLQRLIIFHEDKIKLRFKIKILSSVCGNNLLSNFRKRINSKKSIRNIRLIRFQWPWQFQTSLQNCICQVVISRRDSHPKVNSISDRNYYIKLCLSQLRLSDVGLIHSPKLIICKTHK